jgi:hypothetical protein
LIAFVAICRSMVALSAGDGSVPSLIALRNSGGVIRFSLSLTSSPAV